MDETYCKVQGVWKYLNRTMDKDAKTVDFMSTAKRHQATAKRFFDKAALAGVAPERVTMNKSGTNSAAINEINAASDTPAYSGERDR